MLKAASGLLNAATAVAAVVGSVLLGSCLAACSTTGSIGANDGPCLDDSKACVARRTAMVEQLVGDSSRGWVGQTVDRRMAASGIRLFAYQGVMDGLDCPKLVAGVKELQAAKSALSAGPLSGQTAERHNQIRALTADTEATMTAKARKKGCKA
jgi:hypothetical protein